jgi:hypothetical protein
MSVDDGERLLFLVDLLDGLPLKADALATSWHVGNENVVGGARTEIAVRSPTLRLGTRRLPPSAGSECADSTDLKLDRSWSRIRNEVQVVIAGDAHVTPC